MRGCRIDVVGGALRWAAVLWVGVCGWMGWSGVAQIAQTSQEESVPTLHVYSNLVQIPTLVLDEDHKPMAPVGEKRFYVSLDSGPRFRATHARLEGDDPITLAVVLDVSQPFPALMPKMDAAVAALAPSWLKARDHVSVYSMDCKLVRSASDVPAESTVLRQSVDAVLQPWRTHGRERWKSSCKGPANLWDSLAMVTQAMSELPGRRVILVVTDGEDRGSKTTWNELRTLAQNHGVAIFGLMQGYDPTHGGRPSSPENIFRGVCELSGGMVLTASGKTLAEDLQRFTTLLRGRYIVEFPHPLDTVGGDHQMDITIEKQEAFIRPSGIAVPVDDPAILIDPNTVQPDPANAPQLGKRKVLPPH
jgi:hypothetical protein